MEATCPCLGCGVEGLNVGRKGQPPFPGSEGAAANPSARRLLVWTAKAAGAPPLTPFFGYNQLNF